jgi:hypothetical protein
MEMKDMLPVAISAVTACVGLLTYRLNAKQRADTLRLRHARPVVDLIHTVSYSGIEPDTHVLRLDVSHRDDKPIAIKELCWYVKSFGTRWPLSWHCVALPDASRLQERKIEAADLLQFTIDIQDIFKPLLGSRVMALSARVAAVATLDVGVILTTGETEVLRTPRTFRDYLAVQLVCPRWLAWLVWLYIRMRS